MYSCTQCGLYWSWGEMFVTKFGHMKGGYLQCVNNTFHCISIHFLFICVHSKAPNLKIYMVQQGISINVDFNLPTD